MARRNRKHATARRLEDRGDHQQDQQRTPDEASDEAQRHVATRDAATRDATPESDDGRRKAPQPSAVKVVLLFWGIPFGLFVLIYVLRHCVNLW